MAEKYFVGLDLGTTGAKTLIFNMKGEVVSSGYKEYKCYYPKPTWVEQDVDELVSAVFETCKCAVHKSGIDPRDIVSVAASTQRGCCVFMDHDDRPLKMISWQDNRTTEEVAFVESVLGKGRFYQITGMPNATTWLLPKILYVREKMPEIWEKTKKHVQLQDALLIALGAEGYFTDESGVALTGLWDTDEFCWSKEIHDKLNLDWDKYPQCVLPGTIVGKITEAVSQKTGLAQGTPVCVGIGDQSAAAVGAGVVYPGMLSVSLGTGGMAVAFLDKKYRDANGKTIICNHAVHGNWQFEGLQNGSAGVLRWFRDEVAALEKEQCAREGSDVYVKLTQMAEQAPPGANGLICMPHFAAAATPRWNSDARGMFFGMTFAHTKNHLVRACMEGIILEQKDIIRSIVENGISIDVVRIIGGPTKSELWNQIQADIYGIPAETLAVKDAAVLGAALAGLVGVGEFDNIREAAGAMVKPGKRYEPIKENVSIYNDIFGIYCKLFDAVERSGAYSDIAKIQR